MNVLRTYGTVLRIRWTPRFSDRGSNGKASRLGSRAERRLLDPHVARHIDNSERTVSKVHHHEWQIDQTKGLDRPQQIGHQIHTAPVQLRRIGFCRGATLLPARRTSAFALHMSAFGGKADIGLGSNSIFPPSCWSLSFQRYLWKPIAARAAPMARNSKS